MWKKLKLIHLWRNFSFLHVFHVQKFEFLHMTDFFSTDTVRVSVTNMRYANKSDKPSPSPVRHITKPNKSDKPSPSTESPVRYITKPTQTDTHYHHHQIHHQQHKDSQVVQLTIFSDRVSLCPFVSIVELLFQFSAIASPSSFPCQWVSLCVSAVFKFLWNLQEAQCVVLSYSLLLSVTPHGWGHAMHQRNVFSATSTSAKRLRRWPSPKL